VAFIIGLYGFLRLNELDKFMWSDIKKKGDVYVGTVLRSKRKGPKKPSEFIISGDSNCLVIDS
jgi:hypothetical protein